MTFPDIDSLIAYSNDSPDVVVYHIDSLRVHYKLIGNGDAITCLSKNVKNGYILAGTSTGKIHLWDYKTRELKYTLNAHQDAVDNIVFSPDGSRFASSASTQVRIWSTFSGTNTLNLDKFKYEVNAISFSGDGKQLAISTQNDKIYFWEAYKNEEMYQLKDDASPICTSNFAPDTLLFAEAGNDKIVRL